MSNNEFVVTPYDPDSHRPALLEFLSAAYSPETLARREKVIRWIEEHHPHRDLQPMRYVVMDGPKVAATMGHLPCDFQVGGRRVPARFTHDLLVDPTYRGRGLAKLIVGNALKTGDFLPGGMWMTGACHGIHLACGFDDAPPLVVRTLVLDTDAFAARKGLSGFKGRMSKVVLAALRRRADARARKNPHGVVCRGIESFDDTLDETWARLGDTYGATLIRDAALLNWKYMNHPVLDYQACVVERGGQTVGYVIWRRAWADDPERRAVIADFLAANGDAVAFQALVAHVVRDVAASGAAVLSAVSTQPWALKVLRSFGFLPRQEKHAWVIGNWKGHLPEAGAGQAEHWHMCVGDSDGDIWTGSA